MEHRDVIVFVDNSAALASVVRGESKCESTDVAAGTTHSCSCVAKSEFGLNTTSPGRTGATAPPESLHGTPFASPTVSHSGKFCARLGLGASNTAPHRSFVTSVVWSSGGVGSFLKETKCSDGEDQHQKERWKRTAGRAFPAQVSTRAVHTVAARVQQTWTRGKLQRTQLNARRSQCVGRVL